MSTPDVMTIANAVVDTLHAAGYAEAELRAIPYMSREELDGRKIVVTFGAPAYDETSRHQFGDTYDLRIVLQAPADPADNADLAVHLSALQSLIRLWQKDLSDVRMAGAELVTGPTQELLYEPGLLHQHRMFVSVFSVSYSLEIC